MAKKTFSPTRPKEDTEFENDIEETEDDTSLLSDNATSVPLFIESDGRSLRSIAHLKLHKLEEKGWAYKGQIPLSSTIETIGQLFGDGVYTIEGCNKKHKVLDTKENIRISLGYDNSKQKEFAFAPTNNTAEFDRIERLATKSATESQELTKAYTTMLTTQTQATSAREAAFMEKVNKQQTDFMSGMMLMQAQGFQQTMALLQAGHNMVVSQIKATTENKEKVPGVKEMMELFMSGINVARELEHGNEGEELPFWQEILGGGVNILENLSKKPFLSASSSASADGQSMSNPSSAEPTKDVRKRKILQESLRLRALVRSSGLSMEEAVRRLETPAAPDEPESDNEESEESESDDDSDDSFESEESESAS